MKMTSGKFGTLFLIPVTLGTNLPSEVLPTAVLQTIKRLDYFIAENAKSARLFLKSVGIEKPLQEITVMEIDKHNNIIDYSGYFEYLKNGLDTGLLSEAGMPAVADPGSSFVRMAHREGIVVKPLIGPSSILLALAGSGLNGQNFCFHGYLPKDKLNRIEKLRLIEKNSFRNYQTQLFIETPYRNQALFEDILNSCSDDTLLCVAADLTLPTEEIHTKLIREWKKHRKNYNKRPAVFLILAG
jgi:16S rRNA (cytidine1402-2'-O)-methyltransferase